MAATKLSQRSNPACPARNLAFGVSFNYLNVEMVFPGQPRLPRDLQRLSHRSST